jgi:steroid 5-alpha reductase family enzyme
LDFFSQQKIQINSSAVLIVMTTTCLLVLIGVALSAAMTGAWVIARHPGQSGWTDAIWSFATGAAGVVAALTPIDGPPDSRQWLVASLAAGWALRLGFHIAQRTAKGGEDPRYLEMRHDWGAAFPRRLFLFLQVQAAAALLLVVSILLAARNPAPALVWSDGFGALILLVAVLGEGVADQQLTRFRAAKCTLGRVCDTGLWRLSRHPNYFFEWLGWTGYVVIAIGPTGAFSWGWLALSGPAFMYLLLAHVSGVPPLEAHMLRSRGDAFRLYQERVRAFWPIPKL